MNSQKLYGFKEREKELMLAIAITKREIDKIKRVFISNVILSILARAISIVNEMLYESDQELVSYFRSIRLIFSNTFS